MEAYYSKQEYNEMQRVLKRTIKALEKKVANLEAKNAKLKEQLQEINR